MNYTQLPAFAIHSVLVIFTERFTTTLEEIYVGLTNIHIDQISFRLAADP